MAVSVSIWCSLVACWGRELTPAFPLTAHPRLTAQSHRDMTPWTALVTTTLPHHPRPSPGSSLNLAPLPPLKLSNSYSFWFEFTNSI